VPGRALRKLSFRGCRCCGETPALSRRGVLGAGLSAGLGAGLALGGFAAARAQAPVPVHPVWAPVPPDSVQVPPDSVQVPPDSAQVPPARRCSVLFSCA